MPTLIGLAQLTRQPALVMFGGPTVYSNQINCKYSYV